MEERKHIMLKTKGIVCGRQKTCGVQDRKPYDVKDKTCDVDICMYLCTKTSLIRNP